MEMAYIIKEYSRANVGDTFLPKSKIVPCSLAWAKIPKMGIKTADKQNPKVTNHQKSPDLNPSCGGNIKFPAPKKSEKRAKAITRVSLVLFMIGNFVGNIEQKEQKTIMHFVGIN